MMINTQKVLLNNQKLIFKIYIKYFMDDANGMRSTRIFKGLADSSRKRNIQDLIMTRKNYFVSPGPEYYKCSYLLYEYIFHLNYFEIDYYTILLVHGL
jgi:hypothetical protein